MPDLPSTALLPPLSTGYEFQICSECTGVCMSCRSFDQFANLVLEGAVELIIVGALYTEIALGLYVVRGENVVLLGEIDAAQGTSPALQEVGSRCLQHTAVMQKTLVHYCHMGLEMPAEDQCGVKSREGWQFEGCLMVCRHGLVCLAQGMRWAVTWT